MAGVRNPFDRGAAEATEYDTWYDAPLGRSVLEREQQCVLALLHGAARPWLDLGTGSGRFGAALGADVGLDPAPEMLRIAARRMPSVLLGAAEALPFREASIGTALSVTVFEFLPDVDRAFREIYRVLQPGGRCVLGFLRQGSPWASAYEEHGHDTGSVFHGARFRSLDEWQGLAAGAGFVAGGVRSTLLDAPGGAISRDVVDGLAEAASFVAAALMKPHGHEGRRR